MGLAGTTSHAVWAIVVLSVLGGLSFAWFEHAEAMDEARRTAEDLRGARVLTRFGEATFCWDEPAEQARLTTLNRGGTTLDLAELRMVVDGVPLPVTTRYAGEVWAPGETRTLLAAAPVEPDRALLVTPGGDLVYAQKVTCPVLTTILVTPASATMDVGDAQDFQARGYDQFGDPYPGEPYDFSTAAGSVAMLDPATGRFTAGTTAGSFTLTVTSGAVSATVPITIKPGAPASVVVAPGHAGVPAGGEAAFTATALDQWGNVNASSPIAWSTDAGSVTQAGVLTAQTTAQEGLAVTATTTGGVSGSAIVDVKADAPVSMGIAPTDADVTAGATQAFAVTLLDQYGNLNQTAPVAWSTDAGSVSSGGVLTAQTTTATGRSVTATSGALTATATVDVVPGEPATIVVSPGHAGVPAGGTQAFTATVYDQYGNLNGTSTVAWSTNAGSITSGGVLTAQTTAASGLGVTATSRDATGTAVVDVLAGAPETVTVAPSTADVTAGAQRAFTATVRDAYGNVNATAPVAWSTNAGSVSTGGVLTAQTTTASGRSVTATSVGKTGTATVNVVPGQPASITVTPGAAGVPAGGTASFSATVYDQYGNVNGTAAVSWSTTAGSISSGGVLTAQTTAASGRSVTATSQSATRTVTVDVHPAAPASVTITPNPTTVTAGGTRTFTAVVHDSFGNVNATAPVSWSTNAGSITSGGVLTAQTTAATGRTVSATSGGVTQSATVDVLPGPVDTVTVTPASPTVYLNRTQQFTATLRDQYGNVNTTATASWSATSGSITTGGLYTAPATAGSVTVTASANGKTGTATVTVARETHVDAMGTYKNGAPATSFRKITDTVEVRVTVKDHEGVLVPGASVTVEFVQPSGAVAATRTGTTSAAGVASVTLDLPNSAPQGGWTARVTSIAGTGTSYNAPGNVVTSVGFTVTT